LKTKFQKKLLKNQTKLLKSIFFYIFFKKKWFLKNTLVNDLQIAFNKQILKEILTSKYKRHFAFVCDEKVFGDFIKENKFKKKIKVYDCLINKN
jgi:hypothetical protein